MKLGRRTFLKLLGLAPVAAPVVVEAVKAAEASPLLLGIDSAKPDSETTVVWVGRSCNTHYREQFVKNFERHQSLMRSALIEEKVGPFNGAVAKRGS